MTGHYASLPRAAKGPSPAWRGACGGLWLVGVAGFEPAASSSPKAALGILAMRAQLLPAPMLLTC
jgi:hypothetical protein